MLPCNARSVRRREFALQPGFEYSLMITIVSGLPRSGTSMMMQMLAADGLPILSDGERQADVDNPRGYLEWERIKRLPQDPRCIAEAEGKVVKVISRLLLSLPEEHEYRIIFMQRPLPGVMASQDEMLRHRGTFKPGADSTFISAAFERPLREVDAGLDGRPGTSVIRISYHRVLSEPRVVAEELAQFLQTALDVEALARQVDPALYRKRTK
jgi:hypothetical protein